MKFFLYSKYNRPNSQSPLVVMPIPVNRWFHVEALLLQSTPGQRDGSISIWQNGTRIFRANRVVTKLVGATVWGVGNYTDHIAGGDRPGTASIHFDDATVSTAPTHPYAKAAAQAKGR